MTLLKTIGLLTLSNVFMTFAWYAHLKDMKEKLTMNYLYAALCMAGAVFFMFRDKIAAKPPEPVAAEIRQTVE